MSLKARLLQLIHIATRLFNRYPGVVALFGFVSGVASFMLVDRQARFGEVMSIVMLVSWVWLVMENGLRRVIAHWFGWQLPPGLVRYATQMVHQESLFFVLPFFFITTTWNSGQAIFTGVLGFAALVSVIDPLYYKRLAAQRWLYFAFHSLTLFAVLLTALPIIVHLSTTQSYLWALSIALVLAAPSMTSTLKLNGWRRWTALLLLMAAFGSAGWLMRLWVPPASLWLNQVAVTTQFDNAQREPGESLHEISASQLKSQGLYAFTSINVPSGLKERIFHVWLHDGREVDRIALNISGIREAGYRAWTHKRNFPGDAVGRWQVQVVTEAGQMIGVLRFDVTP
ncbi:DUF5924 family protein [Pseudomonas matsuisoli]|uniref:DUF2914 domain-containing protein n=1 Tax=Pseudomonas matsuisoli TaxID=1515666 RepID=A0A917UYT7_9PSED|nr:DUF5924 family protein [Pseudomonas matsuisoli]GGJ97994.1 hypothetical protein GCM10009304_24860 [Pseudomonas matsuisoli]